VDGDKPADVEALHRFLRDERAVSAYGDLAWGRSDKPDQMGIVIDVLTLVLGSGLSAAQLVFAIAQWWASRPVPPAVTISRGDRSGTTVRIEAATPHLLAEAVRELEEP